MKRSILSFIFFLSLTVSIAQRNSILIYGNLGINSSKDIHGVKASSFVFSPAMGYQWNDHWTAGVNYKIMNGKMGFPQVKHTSFAVGPFIRYAFPLSNIFALYMQFNSNFLSDKMAGIKSNGFEGILFPAIGVNLKNGFALNFSFGSLSVVTNKFKGDSRNISSFGLNLGSGAGFGISKNFSF